MRNRMVSFIHGILCMFMSIHLLLTQEQFCGSESTQYEYFILLMSTGYFTYDFCSMAWFGLLDLDMTIHHLLCVGGLAYTVF